jgi:hypothetical protein
MQACSQMVVVRLTPREYRNLVELAALQGKSLSDLVREYLCLPPESEVKPRQKPSERRLRIIDTR